MLATMLGEDQEEDQDKSRRVSGGLSDPEATVLPTLEDPTFTLDTFWEDLGVGVASQPTNTPFQAREEEDEDGLYEL